LLVEDDEDDYILTQAMLSRAVGESFQLHWAPSLGAALEILQREELDVLLVDYDLGAHNGLEVIRSASELGCRVPSILLTGRGSYDVDIEAMRAGAVDYIAKSEVTPLLLERAIRYAAERQKSEEALMQANEQLAHSNALLAQAKDELEARVQERTRELQERDARLQLFYTQLPAVVWSTNTNLLITYIQGKGLQGTHLQPDSFTGKPISEFAGEGPEPGSVVTAHRRALEGSSVSYEMFLRDRTYQCYVEPLYGADGARIGTVGIGLDVTAGRQMEAELAEVQRRLIDNTEAERLRLSQELHDGPMQDLYGLSFQLEMLRLLSLDEQGRLVPALREKLLAVIQTLRELSGELRPPTLTPFGLEKAIRSHAEGFRATQPDLEIHLELQADGRQLSERLRLALFRIYQMAIANVLRHAQADRVEVRFNLETDQVRLEIEDNGRGFQTPSRWVELVRGGHFGLAGAAERAEAVGGKLEVRSTPGSGTLIRVTAPRNGL
jgi:signal transduction histidine kinase